MQQTWLPVVWIDKLAWAAPQNLLLHHKQAFGTQNILAHLAHTWKILQQLALQDATAC